MYHYAISKYFNRPDRATDFYSLTFTIAGSLNVPQMSLKLFYFYFLDQQKGEECPQVSQRPTSSDLSEGEENKRTKWKHQRTT